MKYLYNGNKILERYFDGKFGQIEEGYKADLVILDYLAPTPMVNQNPGGHFIFGITSRSVETVIVDGKIVYEDRKFPFEIQSIYQKAQIAAKKLWENMDKL